MKDATQRVRGRSGRTTARRWLVVPMIAALAVAACGSADDEVTSGVVADETSESETSSTTGTDGDDEAGDESDNDSAGADDSADTGDSNTGDDASGDDAAGDDASGDDASGDDASGDDAADDDAEEGEAMADDGSIRTESFDEVLSAAPAEIDEIVALDDTTIGVRFVNAAEPCARARVTVTETDDAVTVALETGLHPNAAAMSCIAAVMNYEIPVALEAPVGDRALVAVDPTEDTVDGPDPGDDDQDAGGDAGNPEDDVDNELAGYVGLSEADAEAKALGEGRSYRIERRDGEDFALTMDFEPTRVNVTIESGVVVAARTG